MNLPEDVRAVIAQKFDKQKADWLLGRGEWPLEIKLRSPAAEDFVDRTESVAAWLDVWHRWTPEAEVFWEEKTWRRAGRHRIPARIEIAGPERAAALVDRLDFWNRSTSLVDRMRRKWSERAEAIAEATAVNIDALVAMDESDLDRLERMVAWLATNPDSGLYIRQVPVRGVDTKWLERNKELVSLLLAAVSETSEGHSGTSSFGLKRPPKLVRIRLLDPVLRAELHGIGDLALPVEQAARLDLPISTVVIVENLQTGLSLDDLSGGLAILGRGYGVEPLEALPWISSARCLYWGDLDTHGFAILNRARSYIPHLESVLMDERTLLDHRDLWSFEEKQHPGTSLDRLGAEEARLFSDLRNNRWGIGVRMEQERLALGYCRARLREKTESH